MEREPEQGSGKGFVVMLRPYSSPSILTSAECSLKPALSDLHSGFMNQRQVRAFVCWSTAGLSFLATFIRPETAPAAETNSPLRYEFREEHDRDGIGKFYFGREIAHVMGHQAADWLERSERD